MNQLPRQPKHDQIKLWGEPPLRLRLRAQGQILEISQPAGEEGQWTDNVITIPLRNWIQVVAKAREIMVRGVRP